MASQASHFGDIRLDRVHSDVHDSLVKKGPQGISVVCREDGREGCQDTTVASVRGKGLECVAARPVHELTTGLHTTSITPAQPMIVVQ